MTTNLQSGMWYWSESLGEPAMVIETKTLWDVTTVTVKDAKGNVHELISTDLKRLTKENPDLPDKDNIIHIAAGTRLAHHLSLPDTLTSSINPTIEPLPHQFQHLQDALTRDSTRLLMADEVGLGKTITAGLILSELKNRGQSDRVLILTPSGLVPQWIQEMRDHFNLELTPLFTKLMPTPDSGRVWTKFDHVIASYDSVKPMTNRRGWTQEDIEAYNNNRFHAMLDAGWDLVIIDEAHRMAGSSVGVARNALAGGISAVAPNLLLLTGTPHQGKVDQFHRLVQFLDADAFSTPDTVTRESLRPYLLRTLKEDAVTMDGEPLFVEKNVHLALLPRELQSQLYQSLYAEATEYIRTGYAAADNERRRGIGFLMVLVQRRLASSIDSLEETLRRRLAFLEENGNPAEELDEWSIDPDSDIHEESINAPSFNPAQEIDWIRRLLDVIQSVRSEGPDPKAQYLLELIRRLQQIERDPKAKILIFTEFYGTQDMLMKYLSQHGYQVAILKGSMDLNERLESLKSFKEDAQILVSTEAGGEGLNLQFAHLVINYDLPWNPMRIEQRIGRVHRIGQRHPVTVYNLLLNDTVEYRVVKILSDKLENILTHLGVDKLSDVLDTPSIDNDLQGIYRDALMLDEQQLEDEIDHLLEGIRNRVLEARRAQELAGEPLDLDRIKERLAQPVSYWIETFATHSSTSLKPDLQDENTRTALKDLRQWVKGEPIPKIKIKNIPPAGCGIWSLWKVGIKDGRSRKYVRYSPILENDSGEHLHPTATKIWDSMIDGDFELISSTDEEKSTDIFQNSYSIASDHFREDYARILEEHNKGLRDDLDRHERSLNARRAAIEALGLPEVRRYRHRKLDEEDRSWRAGTARDNLSSSGAYALCCG